MKRLLILAVIMMNTTYEEVCYDPYRDLSNYDSSDILVFTYDEDYQNAEIEVTCAEGENCTNEEETKPILDWKFQRMIERYTMPNY